MVSRSIAGLGSIGIVVKERYSVGEIIPTGVAMLPLILRVYESCRYDKGVMHYRIAVKICRLGQKKHYGRPSIHRRPDYTDKAWPVPR
jgi:hypothetical protein